MKLLAFVFPGGPEWIIIGIIALLLFGRRLPMVARNLGSSFNQFKAGLKDNKLPDDSKISDEEDNKNDDSKTT